MLELHSFGEHSNGRFRAVRQPAHREKKLVLLGFDAGLARGVFTEAEKTADLVAQFRHRLEVGSARFFLHISYNDNIVIRYK